MTNPNAGALTASVKPHEARELPCLPDQPVVNDALLALVTACNGFPYPGSDMEAQFRAIRFLRSRPDIAQVLGLGVHPDNLMELPE